MGKFQYPFNTRFPNTDDAVVSALAANFRQAATEGYVGQAVDAYAATASGLYVPKSLGDAKGDLIGFSADNTPVKIDGSGASNGAVLTRDSGETPGVGWVPRFGARMYLQSNFSISNDTVTQIGAGGSYWIEESDTSPSGNVVETGSNPRFYIPVTGYYALNLAVAYATTTSDIGISAFLNKSASTISAANMLAADYGEQDHGQLVCSVNPHCMHVLLTAGDYVYPIGFWKWGGGGSHTIGGTAGYTNDITYMELRYLGPT